MCEKIKGNNEKFETVEEFVDNLSRGGEIEFVFEESDYSLTHPKGKLCFIKVGDESSLRCFEKVEELLECKINGRKTKDIVEEIQPTFRCF